MSKTSVKITQASLNQTALDWPQNMANHYAAIDEAVLQKSDMVLMPELSITGYEVNDDFQRTDNHRIHESLTSIAAYACAKDPSLIVTVGHPWRLQLRSAFVFSTEVSSPDILKNSLYDRLNQPFNVQTLICGGEIIGMTAKANLFRDERGYENRYFSEWSFRDSDEVAAKIGLEANYGTIPVEMPDGKMVPFGRPLIFVTDEKGNNYIHATAICEEKWAASKFDGLSGDDNRYPLMNIIPSISNHLGRTDGIFLEIANASPPTRLKQDKHIHLNNLASEYVDVVADTDGLGTSGASFAQYGHRLITQNGSPISAGQRLTFGKIATTTSVVSINTVPAGLKSKTHATLVRKFKSPNSTTDYKFAWNTKESAWDSPTFKFRWIEELIRNQALWMFDYLRKTKSNGIAEALSGGKDSSFNCAMIRVMVELAMSDLGVEGFCEELEHLPYKDQILLAYKSGGKSKAITTCMENMLTAVYMGTNNSSYETWYAAKTLIEGGKLDTGHHFDGIGGKFLERNIQDLVTSCAFVFGTENSAKIDINRKNDIVAELSKFVHASSYDYTPYQMKQWADKIRQEYPELETLTSAALPGHEIGYENFQARVREVLIMAVANVEKKMAVANPNLDEAYGAYATFGGDLHSGTVNWNAGIHKSDQEAIMEYLEVHGVKGVMNGVTALSAANSNRPSAELQPKKDGSVAQFDEDALQGTFPQKAKLARLRHHCKIRTDHGDRWMNARELYAKAREDALFDDLDNNLLFNAIAYFYQRWEGPAQHKVHATPIAPSHGESVDHQTSLRTPNLSGGSRDEIVGLGLDIMFDWAQKEDVAWSQTEYKILHLRAWQDKKFIEEFYILLNINAKSHPNVSFNLRGVYDAVKTGGWHTVFSPLCKSHPILSLIQ